MLSEEEWAIDFEGRIDHPLYGDPIYAHQIVEVKNDGELKISACGRRFTRVNHPKGWWGYRPSENLIHCEAKDVK